MARVKLALIGCGGMSAAHVRRFHLLRDRLQLVAAVDVDEARARQVREHLPDVRVATDHRSVLDLVDAVLVVLPHHLHHPVAKECLQAGKHVRSWRSRWRTAKPSAWTSSPPPRGSTAT